MVYVELKTAIELSAICRDDRIGARESVKHDRSNLLVMGTFLSKGVACRVEIAASLPKSVSGLLAMSRFFRKP